MYCPKCGDVLHEEAGLFTCLRGGMELSQDMASHLHACFVSKSEQPREFRFNKDGYSWGGHWFCPGCGLSMPEQVPGAMLCPECGRDMGSFIYRLIELHPHASDLTEQKS